MLYKASNSLNAVNVKFALRWIACARRPLKVEELQEAAAFISSNNTHGSPDQRWDADKIPDADKLLQSCHGLVVRDRDGTVRFAHHTVRQFLLIIPSPVDKSVEIGRAASSQFAAKGVDQLKFTRSEAETSIAELCATYLCFSDFESALTTTEKQQNLTINTIFKQGGPVAIPASLGIRRQIYDIPYRFLGGRSDFQVPDIDFAKQVRMRSAKVSPSSDLRAKYGMYCFSLASSPPLTFVLNNHKFSAFPHLSVVSRATDITWFPYTTLFFASFTVPTSRSRGSLAGRAGSERCP